MRTSPYLEHPVRDFQQAHREVMINRLLRLYNQTQDESAKNALAWALSELGVEL